MKTTRIIILAALTMLLITGCGSNKKHVALNVHSDPLGAYGLMQVKYKNQETSDWIYLGPTPIDIDREVKLKNAIEVSLKVIRPGFHERVKTWKTKDFIKEYKKNKKIFWVPNMVQQ